MIKQIPFGIEVSIESHYRAPRYIRVAQSGRAVVSKTICQRFESSHVCQNKIKKNKKMSRIKEMVSNNKQVHFEFYQNANLNYKTENGFAFPVPTAEAGDAAVLAQDKAMFFMRYIRKELARDPAEQIDIENVISDNKQVVFIFYRKGEMWYKTDEGFEFPVAIDETEGLRVAASMDESLFTVYISDQENLIAEAKAEI